MVLTVRILFERRAVLVAENLALRQQLAVLRRSVKRPRVKARDRIFWALIAQIWSGWRSGLIIVQPATVSPLRPYQADALEVGASPEIYVSR